MTKIKRKHHYIQKALIKKWAKDNKVKYSRFTNINKITETKVVNIERDKGDFWIEFNYSQDVENGMNNLENNVMHTIDKIINSDIVDLNKIDFINLCFYTILHSSRTPLASKSVNDETGNKIFNIVAKLEKEYNIDKEYELKNIIYLYDQILDQIKTKDIISTSFFELSMTYALNVFKSGELKKWGPLIGEFIVSAGLPRTNMNLLNSLMSNLLIVKTNDELLLTESGGLYLRSSNIGTIFSIFAIDKNHLIILGDKWLDDKVACEFKSIKEKFLKVESISLFSNDIKPIKKNLISADSTNIINAHKLSHLNNSIVIYNNDKTLFDAINEHFTKLWLG